MAEADKWKSVRSSFSVLVISGLVSACGATQAQQQATTIRSAMQIASISLHKCESSLAAEPQYAGLAIRTSLVGIDKISIEQKMDTNSASQQEISELVDWRKKITLCRDQLLEQADASFPFYSPYFRRFDNSVDQIFLSVAQHKIAWGEANQQLVQARLDNMQGAQQTGARVGAQLDAQHRTEMADRAATWAAVGNAVASGITASADVYLATRPVTTSCYTSPNSFRCTTR